MIYKCDYCKSEFKKNKGHYTYNVKNNISNCCSNLCRSLIKGTVIKTNCLNCNKQIFTQASARKRYINGGRFCTSTCAASYNNKKRPPMSDSQKKKISSTLKKKYISGELKPRKYFNNQNSKYTNIIYINCSQCNKLFIRAKSKPRKTCSRECAIKASTSRTYLNGSRKTIKYFNKYQLKNVTLESSWELDIAKYLDSKNIIWLRPDPMKWIDDKNVLHMYYPDFYLIKYNTYLDPKNPYCMKLDEEKMYKISQKVNIIYGDIKIIKDYINKLL